MVIRLDAFGRQIKGSSYHTADYLDQSAFDEKFVVDIKNDTIRNIYHIENKYFVPVMQGSFREMYEYAKLHMVHPQDRVNHETMNPDTVYDRLNNAEPKGMIKWECREKLLDGSYRWVQYIGISGTEHGVPEGLIWFYVFDIQNQRDRQEGRISSAQNIERRDELTGLMMRDGFISEAKRMVQSHPDCAWCCVAIDIQHFKIFNSWFGEEKGNYVLARIGTILREYEARKDVLCAYFGRDNFGVLMVHDVQEINALFTSIRDIIFAYSKMAGFMPAFGINLLEGVSHISLDIYDRARIAVEKAKLSYTNRICYFDSEEYHRRKEEYALLTEFQAALINREIEFCVQPQCRISTGKVIGAEALARWVKDDGKVIVPGKFIPFLEKNGFITELDKYIWEAVCIWIRGLIDGEITPVPVSVNVSPVDILSMDVAAYLYALTERYNVPAALLKVEITESAYAENSEKMSAAVTRLQEKGFSVYMDDFGAGYSSLNMLDKINVDVLKLDMAFMRRETGLDHKGISIVESIVSMTHALDIPIIVEGVENEEQLSFLKDLGCRYAQGFYFHRPMKLKDFEKLISEEGNVDTNGFTSRSTEQIHLSEFLHENIFTDTVLNNILGAVAYYSLDGENLTITRFNEQFYRAIDDASMEKRQGCIQNYVVKEDHPALYRALEEAYNRVANGGRCEVRFYKSDNSVFWFRMRFFFLRKDGTKRLYYGQVEDITETREQSIHFLEVLRKQSVVTMRLNLDQNRIQYVTGKNTLYQPDLPSIALDESVRRTAMSRIISPEERDAFVEFFNVDRLKNAFHRAIYHETLEINFIMADTAVPVEFSTYYIRHRKDQDLIVYAFANLK